MSANLTSVPTPTDAEVQVQKARSGIDATLDQLGLYRLETKAGRVGVGQCLYTIFSGNVDGLYKWRTYCARANSKVPDRETTDFWLAARELSDYGLEKLQGWVREDRAWELLEQMSPERRNEKEKRLDVGQVLYNAFNGTPTGHALWTRYCRAGDLSNEELIESEEFWEKAKIDKKLAPRLLRDWATADSGQ